MIDLLNKYKILSSFKELNNKTIIKNVIIPVTRFKTEFNEVYVMSMYIIITNDNCIMFINDHFEIYDKSNITKLIHDSILKNRKFDGRLIHHLKIEKIINEKELNLLSDYLMEYDNKSKEKRIKEIEDYKKKCRYEQFLKIKEEFE